MIKKQSVLFAGDFRSKTGINSDLFDSRLANLIRGHDISWVNLEGPVLPNKNINPIKKAGPNIFQERKAIGVLEQIGFNGYSLANNHIMDYGRAGLQNTLLILKNNTVTGAAVNKNNIYRGVIREIDGNSVGFLSFAEWGFGAAENDGGFAWVNHPSVNEAIIVTKKKVDFLVIQVHAGVEEIGPPLPEWRQRYREMIDLGADLIIGHHPHIPQGMEIYKGKEIFYSLGNLYFENEDHSIDVNGLLISLSFISDSNKTTGKTKVFKVKYCEGKILAGTNVKTSLGDLGKSDHAKYIKTVDRLSIKLWNERYKKYYVEILKPLSRIQLLLTLFVGWNKWNHEVSSVLLLHNIKIESHRWVVERALGILNEQINTHKEK